MEKASIISLLDETGERCFTCGSVRFVMLPELRHSIFHWRVHFQNMGVRDATVTLMVIVTSSDMSQIKTPFECPANDAGSVLFEWPMPEDCSDETQLCLIHGNIKYAELMVSEEESETLLGISVLPMPVGPFHLKRPRDDSFAAFQGEVAALDVDFARGIANYVTPDGSANESLPPVVQWLLLGVMIAIGVMLVASYLAAM